MDENPDPATRPDRDAVARAIAYHERTKHRVDRYARSLGYLDWDNQPDPFRRYQGAVRIPLDLVPPHREPELEPRLDDLASPGRVPARALDRGTLSQLLFDSLALSAWKVHGGARWSLRVNPSSGNLHPTEGYLLCGAIRDVLDEPALCHYAPFDHCLERRRRFTDDEWSALTRHLPEGAILFGLSSIHWRESWKYGERAYRYCQHDVGHAIATVTLAAAALGWRARAVTDLGDADLALLLGVHDQRGIEAEHPDCLLALWPGTVTTEPPRLHLTDALRHRLSDEPGEGSPNALSSEHHDWPVIDDVTDACRWPADAGAGAERSHPAPGTEPAPRDLPARPLFRRRRSAVAMDGATRQDRESFYRMLGRLDPSRTPFTSLPWPSAIDLAIFVHRVDDLDPGLYLLVRDGDRLDALRAATRGEFRWTRAPGCPEDLGLWTLAIGACNEAARSIACGQDIAADGTFALGMLAEFEPRLSARGAFFYRCLHWEAGAIGQMLYLEAEAAGLRATGIGCFLDDRMHELLGLEGTAWQTIYHFTVGGPVDDARLRTLDAYAHLDRRPG